jgi:hypothetical protein
MLLFFHPVLDKAVAVVTDKPDATTGAPAGLQPALRTLINENNGSHITDGLNNTNLYPVTYHGGPVMATPGKKSFINMYRLQIR